MTYLSFALPHIRVTFITKVPRRRVSPVASMLITGSVWNGCSGEFPDCDCLRGHQWNGLDPDIDSALRHVARLGEGQGSDFFAGASAASRDSRTIHGGWNLLGPPSLAGLPAPPRVPAEP